MKKCLLLAASLLLAIFTSFGQRPIPKEEIEPDMPLVRGRNVTFMLEAPKASNVKIYGDFLPGVNGFGLGGNVSMTKDEKGVWTYTAENLEPDFYFYYYEIDGVSVLDPRNIRYTHNFRENYNSFLIEGEESRYYDLAPKHKGSMTAVWYWSEAIGEERRMFVYLPYGYNPKNEYPVLYLHHGGGDDEQSWVDMGRAGQILDNMIAAGKVEPMIVVIPNLFDNMIAARTVTAPLTLESVNFKPKRDDELKHCGKYYDDLFGSIIPFIESNYNIKPGRDSRAISGLSMGGGFTLYVMQHRPDAFGYWALMGAGLWEDDDPIEVLTPLNNTGYRLLWTGTGTKDMTMDKYQKLKNGLDSLGMSYVYFDSQDGHNWRSWRRDLVDLLPRLFK